MDRRKRSGEYGCPRYSQTKDIRKQQAECLIAQHTAELIRPSDDWCWGSRLERFHLPNHCVIVSRSSPKRVNTKFDSLGGLKRQIWWKTVHFCKGLKA